MSRTRVLLCTRRRSETVLKERESPFCGVLAILSKRGRFPQAGSSPKFKQTRSRLLGRFDSEPVADLRLRSVSPEQKQIAMDPVQFGCGPQFTVLAKKRKSACDVCQRFA